jgi:hypothetical protein
MMARAPSRAQTAMNFSWRLLVCASRPMVFNQKDQEGGRKCMPCQEQLRSVSAIRSYQEAHCYRGHWVM